MTIRWATGAALLWAGLIGSLIQSPSASAGPELDFCRDMAAVGHGANCATLTSLAKEVCASYDRGVDWPTIAQRLDLATKDEDLTNYIIAGAPLYFCPQHDGKT